MSDAFTENGTKGAKPEASLFDFVTDTNGEETNSSRVQELKRMLFDLAYLVVNADGVEHISERMLVRELEGRLVTEGSVDVEARADALTPILEGGPLAIRERVRELGDAVAERAGDRMDVLGNGYLDLLKGVIVADANVSPEEYELFRLLCDRWGVEKELPRA